MPSDTEILATLAELHIALHGTGIQKLVRALKSARPQWIPAVDSKRVRALRDSAPPSPEAEPFALTEKGHDGAMQALVDVLASLCAGGDMSFARRAAQIDLSLKNALSTPASPLSTRQRQGESVSPDDPTTFVARSFQEHARMYPARSCKLTATLVLVFCAPDAQRPLALAWLSRALGGMPSAAHVMHTPSADLGAAYTRALHAAESGWTSAIGVNLVDVEMLVRSESVGGGAEGVDAFESFAHSFVVVAGPEGVRILQAWGEHGYSLAENVKGAAGRLRTPDEGAAFVRDFERLCGMKGAWSKEINRLYARLFDVDVLALMRSGGQMRRPMVPKFRAWVRILEVPDVRRADVERWAGVVKAVDGEFGL